MLEGKGIYKKFGGLIALDNVNFVVKEKEVVGLIGPNGSGKTTLFNLISGVYKPDGGEILFEGNRISGLPTYKIAKMGIGRTFQIVKPFPDLTALENVAISVMNGRKKKISLRESFEKAATWIEFLGMGRIANRTAKDLTLMDQKQLEISRALALEPKVLLLDEVMAGLNSVETQVTMGIVKELRDELGITIFMIEHVMKAVMAVSDRVIVLNFGKKIAEGVPKDVCNNEEVIECYLGA